MRTIGSTGLAVSSIGLGAMPLSIQGRRGVAVIHAALDAGVTLIDTADVYCLDDSEIGHNERLIARALAPEPEVPLADSVELQRQLPAAALP